MAISQAAREDLRWWSNNLSEWNGRQIQDQLPDMEIETDASLLGWGAYCMGECTGGCWSLEEKKFHINALELLGATFGVKAFCKQKKVESVLLKTDNTTVVAYVNRMGGTKSPLLCQLAKELWQWCLSEGIKLKAQHLPGKRNIKADFLSRHLRDRSDWILDAELFQMIDDKWGPLQVDLFATRFSARLPRFYSWRPDPLGEATDAFIQDWSTSLGYANPPWCLIARVLQKAQAQEATLVIVVPLWSSQACMVSTVGDNVDRSTNSTASGPSNPVSISQLQLSNSRRPAPIDRVQGLRLRFQADGISEEAIKLILASWRSKTDANYNSAWRKWQGWCNEKGANPFNSDLSLILGFLATEFGEGKQYRSLNCFRSAISSAHLPVDGFPVGRHPLVCRLLKGAFNSRPPQPRYEGTWDVTRVTSS